MANQKWVMREAGFTIVCLARHSQVRKAPNDTCHKQNANDTRRQQPTKESVEREGAKQRQQQQREAEPIHIEYYLSQKKKQVYTTERQLLQYIHT